jgi:hypothetical protein
MLELSQGMTTDVSLYRHCEYQSGLAAIIASMDNPFIIVNSPTGSGKTWI